MAEYIERQKLINAIPIVNEDKQISLYGAVADFIVIASSIPTADVVEVVRCKDCKFFGKNRPYRDNKLPFAFCDKFHHNITTDDDFCSYGERKEGAEE